MKDANTSIVLITEPSPLFNEGRKVLEKYAIVKVARGTSEDYLISEISDVDVLMVVYAKVTRKIITSARKLKGIVRYGIGVDNIDLEAATENGIFVANVPDYCIEAVADHTFGLLLALNRKILIADRIMRTGNWGIWTSPCSALKGRDLQGKILGLIGVGKIGSAVAKRAKAFGMEVIAYDPYLKKEVAENLGVKLVDLETLLKESDFVSIHAPLTPETRGMISERELRLMKKSAYLINTARGPIVQEDALVKALEYGWIAGAGIDVYENEPPSPQSPLLRLENTVLSPHISWYTEEAMWRLEMSAVEEAVRILKGLPPKNLVNKEVLPCARALASPFKYSSSH